MRSSGYGPNVIDVNGAPVLLTTTGGGVAIHLTAPARTPETGREALFDFYFDPEFSQEVVSLARYDRAALIEPRWSRTTLCGRQHR